MKNNFVETNKFKTIENLNKFYYQLEIINTQILNIIQKNSNELPNDLRKYLLDLTKTINLLTETYIKIQKTYKFYMNITKYTELSKNSNSNSNLIFLSKLINQFIDLKNIQILEKNLFNFKIYIVDSFNDYILITAKKFICY